MPKYVNSSALTRGIGTLVLEARLGDCPTSAFNYTAGTDHIRHGDQGNTRCRLGGPLCNQQNPTALRADIESATEVGRKLFPAEAASLIAAEFKRVLPFYKTAVSPEFVKGMNAFSNAKRLVEQGLSYDRVVATEFSSLWSL